MPGICRVMVLDPDRIVGKLEHLRVLDAETLPSRPRNGNISCAAMTVSIDHAHLLAPERPAQDDAMAATERRLVDVELIGIDGTLHDILAQAVDASDEHDVAEPGFCIEREHNTARSAVGSDHLHDSDRERDLEVIKSIVDSIGDGPIGEDRSEAVPAGFEQLISAADVQETFVLACKARRRQILGGGGAAHGNRNVGAIVVFELSVGLGDLTSEAIGTGSIEDDRAGLGGAAGKLVDAGLIERVEQRMQSVPCAGRGQRVAVGLSGQRKSVRHPDALSRQNRIEFAQRRVLSAHGRDIAQPNIAEPTNAIVSGHRLVPTDTAAC